MDAGAKELCVMNKSEIAGLLPNLVTFTQVVDGGSFSAAGRTMLLSPSAVARQIDRLEKALGVILFQRTTRHLHVTEAGREIYELALEIIGETDALLARAGTIRQVPQGFLHVSAPVTLGKMVLAPLIPQFLEQYPDVHIDLDLSDNIVDLLREQFDLAVRITNQPPENMVARALMPVSYVLVCAKGYRKALPAVLEELRSHPVFIPKDRGFGARCRFMKDGAEHMVLIQPRLVSNNSDVMLDTLLQGHGIGILPFFVAQRLVDAGALAVVLPEYAVVAPRDDVAYVISPPKYLIPQKARVFIDFLMENVRQKLENFGSRSLLLPS
jgi:DNA-binding transcriptional LysR family regulator